MAAVSIQELVTKPIHRIPSRFLVDQEPSISYTYHQEIPTIDMKRLLHDSEGSRTLALQEFHFACKDWGIFQLVNHGVESSLMEKLKYEIQEFYNLPLEERLKYKIRSGDFEGYGPRTIGITKDDKVDWADRFYMITNPIHKRKSHLLPDFPSPLRECLEEYISELQKLSSTIFGLLAEVLGIEKQEVVDMFEDGMQSMRMNYYPPCPQPEKVIGLTPHSDASGITILFQANGVGGLQIKRDGVWIPVNILTNAFVVNLGDVMEIVSNGLYKSIEHRATVNSEKERVSVAMFFNSKFEAKVGPSPALLVNNPPLYRSVTMEQYVKEYFSRKLSKKSFIDYLKI